MMAATSGGLSMGLMASSPDGEDGLGIDACGNEATGLEADATAGAGACATIGAAPSS
ncbi:hypothetical protein [Achromobacter kerstersii]|uniref:hypothetical protein n=1 Tax=Achromobacter kerstersii TaxID=1353890 RepID=UPI0015830656